MAWVGTAPPAQSGLARFSMECLAAAPMPVDFFTSPRSGADFLATQQRLEAAGRVGVNPLPVLLPACGLHPYDTVVFQVGNAAADFDTWSAFCAIKRMAKARKLLVHLHDTELDVLLEADSPSKASAQWRRSAALQSGAPPHLAALLALFDGRWPDGFILNSEAAAKEVANVAPSGDGGPEIISAFHPVFPALRHWEPVAVERPSILSIGVPGRHKQTYDLIDAVARLNAGPNGCDLILAGFGVHKWAADVRLAPRSWMKLIDNTSDAQLADMIATVQLCVQLRAPGRHESSGPAALALAARAPLLVSDIGSFRELPSPPVHFVEAGISGERLAPILQKILDQRGGVPPYDEAKWSVDSWWSQLLGRV